MLNSQHYPILKYIFTKNKAVRQSAQFFWPWIKGKSSYWGWFWFSFLFCTSRRWRACPGCFPASYFWDRLQHPSTLISNNCRLTEIGWIMQFQVRKVQKINWMTSAAFHIPTIWERERKKEGLRSGALTTPRSMRCPCPARSWDRAAAEGEERHSPKE